MCLWVCMYYIKSGALMSEWHALWLWLILLLDYDSWMQALEKKKRKTRKSWSILKMSIRMRCSSKLFDPSCLLISIFITIASLLLSPFSRSDIIQKRKVEKMKWSKVRKFSRVVSYFTNCLIRFGIRELGVRNTNLGVCRIKDSVEALHCFQKKSEKVNVRSDQKLFISGKSE